MDQLQAYEKEYRRSVEAESPLGIGVDLEKVGSQILEPVESARNTSYSESLLEPGIAKTETKRSGQPTEHDVEAEPVRRVVTAQDWMGPDDAENPYNWTTWRRVYHTVPPALIGFAV